MENTSSGNIPPAAQTETWEKLHRRAVIGALLVMGLLVGPFLVMLTWINWAIIFRGKDWSLDVAHPGIPEVVAGVIAAIGTVLFIRAIVFWLIGWHSSPQGVERESRKLESVRSG